MLAGYLPFDDDPANPEGDNINLLYKYIVSTPLTFPEYVTPHARDLLRRILVVIGQPLRDGPAAGAGPDDHHVEVRHSLLLRNLRDDISPRRA